MPWKPATGGNCQSPQALPKSIRGQISAPIPIPDATDEEFPIRDQTAVIASNADEASSDSRSVLQAPSSSDQSQTRSHSRAVSAGNIEHSTRRQHRLDNPSSASVQASALRKSSASQHARFARMSDQEEGRRSEASKSQRRKSTVRSALSKLFGRKKKTEFHEKPGFSYGKTSDASALLPDRPPRSDPTWDRSSPRSVEPKRSLSVPITEYDRALRSHSIGPEDVMAITSVRNSINAESRMSDKNLAVLEPPAHLASPRWAGSSRPTGLSPRPASSQDQGTRMAGLVDDPNEIGRAISSEAHGLKRRSRSLSVMPSLELAPQSAVRRRSAEIRYWRESYTSPLMSPTSMTADEETLQLLSGQAEEFNYPAEQRAVTPEQTILMEAVETRVQTSTPTKTAEYAGAAEHLCLDSRVSSLETRMSRLEGIVLQLAQSIPALRHPSAAQLHSPGGRQLAQLQTPDHGICSMRTQPGEFSLADERRQSTSRPSTRNSDASKMTFGDISDLTPRATILSPADGEARSNFLAAPRGPDATPRGRRGSVNFEHYANLMNLFETERSARETLGAQLKSLARQVQVMSKNMLYTNADQSDLPSLDRSVGEVSVFDHDGEDDERRLFTGPRLGYPSPGMKDAETTAEDGSEEEFTDSFVTPVETVKSSFDMYGNENGPTLANGRKLSLSHLTMRQPLTTMQQVNTKAI
ncbi:uncharacterized protein MAM_05855 [Metarhizium album ARSEF 1941]|uniref:Uncharacterized protein n=1 Tax=Metarhizium album (strain ARSEF 1941) TaxID=1081103 RepID=A0A0B2WRP5_METAS|nr:uncharacterized protein MAM_05855 [Metarhizium album ARSEF 1941]KHN96269.1 hypothetical protein MAM_05855 [Metarhizium album ARSEF 1941]